jgi:hypothetical protein
VINGLAQDRIAVLAVYDGSSKKPYRQETRAGFDFIARQTHGVSVPIASANEVIGVIKTTLGRVLQPSPALGIPNNYAAWLRAGGFGRRTPAENRFRAPVTVRAPLGTKNGVYRFPISVLGGSPTASDTLGHTWITVRIGILNYPWRIPLLLIFLASLSLLLLRHLRRSSYQFERFERNKPVLGLLLRIALVVGAIGGVVLIWRFAPGTLPPI